MPRTRLPPLAFLPLLAFVGLLAAAPLAATAGPAITVFESSFISGSTLKNVLDSLGLGYVYRTEGPAFDVDLASGQYDIAMVNSSSVDITPLADALTTFLGNGNRVLLFLYNVDGDAAEELWPEMGAAWSANFLIPPAAMEILVPDHPIFNVPTEVGPISGSSDTDTDNGDYMTIRSRGLALARAAGGGGDHLLIVARRDGHALLNTYLPGDWQLDPDFIDLMENQVLYMVNGIHDERFEVHPDPFDTLFSPQLCTGCSYAVDYDPGPGICYCDTDCISLNDCCYDACTACGRCRP